VRLRRAARPQARPEQGPAAKHRPLARPLPSLNPRVSLHLTLGPLLSLRRALPPAARAARGGRVGDSSSSGTPSASRTSTGTSTPSETQSLSASQAATPSGTPSETASESPSQSASPGSSASPSTTPCTVVEVSGARPHAMLQRVGAQECFTEQRTRCITPLFRSLSLCPYPEAALPLPRSAHPPSPSCCASPSPATSRYGALPPFLLCSAPALPCHPLPSPPTSSHPQVALPAVLISGATSTDPTVPPLTLGPSDAPNTQTGFCAQVTSGSGGSPAPSAAAAPGGCHYL